MKFSKLLLFTILALLAIFALSAEGKGKKSKSKGKGKHGKAKVALKHCKEHDQISVIVRGDKHGRVNKSMRRNVYRAIRKNYTDFSVAFNGKDVAKGTSDRGKNVKFLRHVAQTNAIVLLPWNLNKINPNKPKTVVKQYRKSARAIRRYLGGNVHAALVHKDHAHKKVVRALGKKGFIVVKKTFEKLTRAFHSKKDNFIVTVEAKAKTLVKASKKAKSYMYDIVPLRTCLSRGALITPTRKTAAAIAARGSKK